MSVGSFCHGRAVWTRHMKGFWFVGVGRGVPRGGGVGVWHPQGWKNVYFPGSWPIFPQFAKCFYVIRDTISHQIPKFPTKHQHFLGRSFPISTFFPIMGHTPHYWVLSAKPCCCRQNHAGVGKTVLELAKPCCSLLWKLCNRTWIEIIVENFHLWAAILYRAIRLGAKFFDDLFFFLVITFQNDYKLFWVYQNGKFSTSVGKNQSYQSAYFKVTHPHSICSGDAPGCRRNPRAWRKPTEAGTELAIRQTKFVTYNHWQAALLKGKFSNQLA